MNKKIEEFAKQSQIEIWGTDDYKGSPKFLGHDIDVEKFAELIVRECCDVLYDNELGGYQVNYVLKEHFGVEE